jgi:hypothetical protein
VSGALRREAISTVPVVPPRLPLQELWSWGTRDAHGLFGESLQGRRERSRNEAEGKQFFSCPDSTSNWLPSGRGSRSQCVAAEDSVASQGSGASRKRLMVRNCGAKISTRA